MRASEDVIKALGLQTDLDIYMGNSVRVTPKLAASVARWPVATEEFDVYRGQPKDMKDPKNPKSRPLPAYSPERSFFSTSLNVRVARTFAGYSCSAGDVFKITVKPGVRYLQVSNNFETEILLAADGVAEYGPTKVRATDVDTREWCMAWPVTYSPRTPWTAETPQPAVVEESKPAEPAEPPAETPQPARPPRPKQLPDRVESKPKPMKLRSSMKKPTAGRRKTRRRSLRRRN
jgi:hypothetical protein